MSNLESRRRSIAKLTRPQISSSPLSYSPRGSFSGSPHNIPFRKNEDAINSDSDDEQPNDPPRESSMGPIMEPQFLQKVSENLPDLSSEGADITRDLAKLSNTSRIRRSQSFSSFASFSSAERRGSTASSLNVPGGFRRQFIATQKRQPNFLTANFVEFLSIYGHFAGEDLEYDEDVACHYSAKAPDHDETMLLLENSESYNYINREGTASDKKAYFLLVKAFVGTGVLFLPKAFQNGGMVFSIVTLLGFGLLSYWCYLVLVFAKTTVRVSSFADIGYRLYGSWLQQLILSSIIVSQIGFVGAYIVFTSENLRAFVINVGGHAISAKWYVLLQVFVLVPLSLVRDITRLSLSAVLANLFIMMGLVTIVYYLFYEWLVQNKGSVGPDINFWFNKKDFSVFIGTAIFAFEGIGLIIPIQESMVHPNHFPLVLGLVLVSISIVFVFMGTLGYLAFGSNIQTVILLNLPQNSPFVIMIQLLYSLAILLSTPLQLFPAIRLVESKLFSMTGKTSHRVKWTKNLFRALFVILTAMIAIMGQANLDKFVSFIGCFACIPLVYMYPPILHLKSCCTLEGFSGREYTKRWILGAIDWCLLLIGAVAFVYTTNDILTP